MNTNTRLQVKLFNLKILKEKDYIKEVMECKTIDKGHKIYLISGSYDIIKKYHMEMLELTLDD